MLDIIYTLCILSKNYVPKLVYLHVTLTIVVYVIIKYTVLCVFYIRNVILLFYRNPLTIQLK